MLHPWRSSFNPILKYREESWKYDARRSIFTKFEVKKLVNHTRYFLLLYVLINPISENIIRFKEYIMIVLTVERNQVANAREIEKSFFLFTFYYKKHGYSISIFQNWENSNFPKNLIKSINKMYFSCHNQNPVLCTVLSRHWNINMTSKRSR